MVLGFVPRKPYRLRGKSRHSVCPTRHPTKLLRPQAGVSVYSPERHERYYRSWCLMPLMTTDASNHVRILIADDHELMRRGLRSILATRPDWEVCGEAVDGREAIEKTQLLKPDILLLDISMPRIGGLGVARAVSRDVPNTRVLILSHYEESEMRPQALEAGARGYVSKSEASQQLLTAIESLTAHGKPPNQPLPRG